MTILSTQKKILHLTDIHMNFVNKVKFREFCKKVNKERADAIILTGDISEATTIEPHLDVLSSEIETPIYFVLGNHDYYFGSIPAVRSLMTQKYGVSESVKKAYAATWLGAVDYIPVTDKVAVVGHDGWYDGGYADWFASKLGMTDYQIISDFSGRIRQELFQIINKLAAEAAAHVTLAATKAFENGYQHVFLGTHVPPFPENSVYEGKISDANWLPHFSSRHMGAAIIEMMTAYPEKNLTVLCGHSHGEAVFEPLANVKSVTGKAKYGHPIISGTYSF